MLRAHTKQKVIKQTEIFWHYFSITYVEHEYVLEKVKFILKLNLEGNIGGFLPP